MEIASLCPFTVGTVLWQGHGGGWSLTTCVKGTFKLLQGREAAIADEQEAISGDRYFTGPTSSLYAPSDIVPFKPKTDVMVVGHAYAPGGVPVEALLARFTIGDLSKSIGIVGDRVWTEGPYGLEPSPPSPFTRMPLRYERAARGIGNPIGVDLATPPMAGARALPNLEPADDENPGDTIIGLGPIPSSWAPRRSLLSPLELSWVTQGCRTPVPESFNFGFYNAAPADQQISMLRQGAKIILENLNPEFPRLETRLPQIRPKAFLIDRATQRGSEIALRCDTIWLDTDRALAVLVWRGLTDVSSGDVRALGTLAVAAEMKGQDLRFKHIERLLREEGLSSAETESFTMSDASPLNLRYDGFVPPELAGSPAEHAMSQALRRTANLSAQDAAPLLPGVIIQDTHRTSSAPPPPPISQIPPTLPSTQLAQPTDEGEGDEQNAETVTKKLSVKGVQSRITALRASAPDLRKQAHENPDEPSAETLTQKLDVQQARASMASLPSIDREREKSKTSDEISHVPTSESPTIPLKTAEEPAPRPAAAPKAAPAAPKPAPRAPAAPKPAPAAPKPAPAAPKPAPKAPAAPAAPNAPRAPLRPSAPLAPRAASAPQPSATSPTRGLTPAPRPAISAPSAPTAQRTSTPPPRPAMVLPEPSPSAPPSPPQTALPPKPAMVVPAHSTLRLLSLQDYARVEAGLERGDLSAVLTKFKLDPEGLDANRAHWKDQIRTSAALTLLFEEALEAARWE